MSTTSVNWFAVSSIQVINNNNVKNIFVGIVDVGPRTSAATDITIALPSEINPLELCVAVRSTHRTVYKQCPR